MLRVWIPTEEKPPGKKPDRHKVVFLRLVLDFDFTPRSAEVTGREKKKDRHRD